MNSLYKIVGGFLEIMKQNAPKILTGLGIAGTIGAGYYAVRNTPKACEAIEEKKKELGTDKLKPKELVQTTWKYYIGPVAIELLSIGEILLANKIVSKKYSALATLYLGSEKALEEYQNKVIETIGEKKEQKIREEAIESSVKNLDPSEAIITGYGNTLFYDKYCGRMFLCSKSRIEEGCLYLSKQMHSYDKSDMNDFYDFIGLDEAELGKYFVFDVDRVKKHSVEFKPRYGPAKNGEPMCIIGFDHEPDLDRTILRY